MAHLRKNIACAYAQVTCKNNLQQENVPLNCRKSKEMSI